jgi:hypothetical protein
MNTRLGKLPYKVIQRILKGYCRRQQISKQSVEYVKSFLENQLEEICRFEGNKFHTQTSGSAGTEAYFRFPI